jgi:hypothetical protein
LFKPGPPALYVAGRDRTGLVAGVRKQMNAIESALSDANHADIEVAGVLLFHRRRLLAAREAVLS